MNILFLSKESPYPVRSGAQLRDSNLIKGLLLFANVRMICETGDPSKIPNDFHLEAVRGPRPGLISRLLGQVRPYVLNGFNPNIISKLREHSHSHSIVWVSRLNMAKYIPMAKQLGYRVILDDHNIESEILLSGVRRNIFGPIDLIKAFWCRSCEKHWSILSDAVILTSESDSALLASFVKKKLNSHTIPNVIDVETYDPNQELEDGSLLFTGTLDYFPNVEGLEWFCKQIVPRLKENPPHRVGPIRVAGARPSLELTQHLKNLGIELYPDPEDMTSLFQRASIVIVPILSGGGTRLKILEALAFKKAIVSTSKGAEGLSTTHREHLLLADTDAEFASAIHSLLSNKKLRTSLASQGHQLVKSKYDWRIYASAIEQILRDILKT